MSEQFWYSLWRCVIIGLCFMVATCAGCSINRTLAVERMVAAGAQPLEARCSVIAIETTGDAAVCALKAK